MTNEAVLDEDTMPLADYLARGGKLTSPNNVPPRYRAELLRLMSSFVDSELAGSAGFADAINWAPGLKERIAASRITLEKVDHAEQVLDLMSDFGTDKALYNKRTRGPPVSRAMHRWMQNARAEICACRCFITRCKAGQTLLS
jgi:ring-1,2-phenylacetyl-CoA epoxidase subunit PaaA